MADDNDTWKDIFVRQVASGSRFKSIFKDEFDRHKFLDRSDAVWLCKKAQAEAYESVIEDLQGKVDDSIIKDLEAKIDQLWKTDISALGY